MNKVMKFLKGKKTYFVLGTAAIVWFLESTAIIPSGSLANAAPILGIVGGSTVIAKINRMMD